MAGEDTLEEWQPTFYIGHHDTSRDDPLTSDQLDRALDCNYNMLTTFITNNHFHTRINALISSHIFADSIPTVPHLTHLDTHLEPSSIAVSVIAFTSPWIDICSPDPLVHAISKQILLMEVAFAAFCGFEQVVIQGPRLYHHDSVRGKDVVTDNVMQYARIVQECLNIGSRLQISILLPFSDDPAVLEKNSNILSTREQHIEPDLNPNRPSADFLATWETWNNIRTTCKYHSRLHVALEIPKHLPGTYVQSRWYSEPIKALFLDRSSFVLNAKGYPSLQGSVRSFLKDVMRLKVAPWLILSDVGFISDPNSKGETQYADGYLPQDALESETISSVSSKNSQPPQVEDLAYLNYIRYIERKQIPRSEVERYGAGYQDYLQIPLQPLTDNLESMTYEVFEKDPVKYDLYEQAVRKALRDWADERKPVSSPDGKVVVVVAGAGRGPLVTRALRASKSENVPIDMWAVEKNPNAFVLLQRHNREKWKRQVTVEHSDMRSWQGPWRMTTEYEPTPAEAARYATTPPEISPTKTYYPVDILISELLGSFADNELSPECLDGILHLLAKPSGISIPASYTAWLTPIAAPKIHADISQRAVYDNTAAETPAVVWLHQIDYLSRASTTSPAQTNGSHPSKIPPPNVLCAWSFEHASTQITEAESQTTPGPLSRSNQHNTRHNKLTFRIRNRGVCHGLGGYFESILYPGVELSTNPNTIDAKSKDMISWFPIYFPLKTPLYVPSASTLDVSIWRQTDGRKVWYEWMVESYGWNLLKSGGKEGEKVDRRMVRLGGGELHSSVRGGCLM